MIAFHRKPKRRVCVISLDGVPRSLIAEAAALGELGGLRSLWEEGGMVPLDSTMPPVSAVAWATYATGVGPGVHGVYGFADRDPGTMSLYILDSSHIRARPLWEILSGMGQRVAVINVPLTYPVGPVRGTLVAGFPALDGAGLAYPPELGERLHREGYVVDLDPKLSRDPEVFFAALEAMLGERFALARELLEREWDFFHLHIMATDRLHHFFFRSRLPEGPHHREFWRIYRLIEAGVLELVGDLPEGTELIFLSDHGFCELRWELDLNAFLVEEGFLELGEGRGPEAVGPGSTAYSLTPGRVYLMRRGRERGGHLGEEDAQAALERLMTALEQLTAPDGEPAIEAIHPGEEIYHGPAADLGPDLLVLPAPGVELHSGWDAGDVFRRPRREGGHTFSGAFLWTRGRDPRPGGIIDLGPTIFSLLGLPIPAEFQGTPLVTGAGT
ncbi:alkaline phosphatase family protein [Candidatus Bipolaricaulota bacterium]|nr:alkaline phosphatase family protein [Candidatus Bipolaricaulota bacterium]